MSKPEPPFAMERYRRIKEMCRSFDIAYWQRLGPAAIFDAAWQMVVDAQSRLPGVAMNSEFEELLKALNEENIKYLVVGGYAVMLNNEPRHTKGLGIWVEASEDNAANVFRALARFGAD